MINDYLYVCKHHIIACVHLFLDFECGIQMMFSFNFVDDALLQIMVFLKHSN